jgi:lambda repressor-like predicted transcriptional regulator
MKTGIRTVKIPSNMTPAEINDALKAEGLNQAAIARDQRVSPTAVSLVVHDKSGAKRIADAIGEAIHKDPKYIWPSRYWNGNPQRGPKKVVWQRNVAAA